MAMWNAWRGCKRCSDGCLHCYIHKGDLNNNSNKENKTEEEKGTEEYLQKIEKLKKE